MNEPYLDIFRRSVEIWTEDDALPPGRERLEQAMDRIFPGLLRNRIEASRFDHEDVAASIYERGGIYIIFGYCCGLGFISVARKE